MRAIILLLVAAVGFGQSSAVTYQSGGAIDLSGLATFNAPTPAASDNTTKVATTAYVTTGIANAIAAVNPAVAVQVTSNAVLPNAPNYSNGVAGVGATLISTTMTALVVDGYTVLLNDRVLVKNQAAPAQNGVYIQTTLGTGAVFWVLTRALDFNTPAEMNNSGLIPTDNNGTVNAKTGWFMTSTVVTIGTDAVTFTQFQVNSANIVTAVAPGAGLCHFAGATQTCTSSAVALGAGGDTSGVLLGVSGGTGVANTGFTITLAGNLVTTGAFNTTFAQGATTTQTLPTTSQTIPGMNQVNTAGASMTWDLTSASSTIGLKVPAAAGAVPTADGSVAENTTNHTYVWGSNGTTMVGAIAATGTGTSTTCTNQAVTVISSLVIPTCSTITNAFTNSTVMGIAATTTGAVTIGSSGTDTKVVELSLPAGYLNTANKAFRIEARGIYTTAGITPTLTHKVKLCTVSGCGSGTVLVLYAAPATGATTSGASNTWIVQGALGTISTGGTGTVMLHADACTVLGASGGTACTPTIDPNTAASSTIDLTAALFLDWMVNASTVTTLTETPNVAYIKPMD